MANLILYHKPGRGPCEETKAWLSQQEIPFEDRLLLEEPPSREALGVFARSIPGGAPAMVAPNTHFPEYQEHIAGQDLTEEQLLDVLARVPNLLKKPVLTDGDRILLGPSAPEVIAEFVGYKVG